MKLKEKFQRFWTLSKSHKGFTLVELIVVIAILAILAGVAIPVYNGYIKKAQSAADQQLLDTINTAFAAACLVNGIDHTAAEGTLKIDAEDGTILQDTALSASAYDPTQNHYFDAVKVSGTAVELAALKVFDSTFAAFYAGNEEAGFSKAFIEENGTTLTVDGEGDGDGAGKKEVTYNGKTFYINQSSINDFLAATVFSGNIENMQGQVNTLAGTFGSLAAGLNPDVLAGMFGEDYTKYLEENNIDAADRGNATVLYVAENAAGMTAQDVANTFGAVATYMNTNKDADVIDVLINSNGDPLTNAALMYGAITAYANQPGNDALKTQVEGVKDAGTLLGLFQTVATDSDGFANYVGTRNPDGTTTPGSQFTTDMNGFLGAMDAINTISPDASVENVWTSDAIEDVLNQLLGK